MRAPRAACLLSALVCASACMAQNPHAGIHRDIVYATANGAPLHLDIAMPEGAGPFPAIVCFHGGNWGRHQLYDELVTFARNGFVAASVEYRGLGRGRFPDPLDDARGAVAFLCEQSSRYRVDPSRIGAFGMSFGGWEALMLALTGPSDGVGSATPIHRIKAVVSRYGPTDFSHFARDPKLLPLFVNTLGTSDPTAPEVARASPVHYVSSDDPPALLIHNPADELVPFAQSEMLRDALRKAGVKVEFISITGAGHSSEFRPGSAVEQREHDRVRDAEVAFFKHNLAR